MVESVLFLGHPVWSNLNWNNFIYPLRSYRSIMLHLVEGKFSSKELLLRGWHIIHIYCWWSNYELVLFFGHPVWSNLNWNSSIYPWRIYRSILLHLVEGNFFSNQLLVGISWISIVKSQIMCPSVNLCELTLHYLSLAQLSPIFSFLGLNL